MSGRATKKRIRDLSPTHTMTDSSTASFGTARENTASKRRRILLGDKLLDSPPPKQKESSFLFTFTTSLMDELAKLEPPKVLQNPPHYSEVADVAPPRTHTIDEDLEDVVTPSSGQGTEVDTVILPPRIAAYDIVDRAKT